MGDNNSSLKKYGIILLIGAVGGWYFSSQISNYFSKVEERTQPIRNGIEYVWNLGSEVEPEPVRENADEHAVSLKHAVSLYERFFGRKQESVDDKVSQQNER